jgi:hypothetical protein
MPIEQMTVSAVASVGLLSPTTVVQPLCHRLGK